jgi:hypothetical protein
MGQAKLLASRTRRSMDELSTIGITNSCGLAELETGQVSGIGFSQLLLPFFTAKQARSE